MIDIAIILVLGRLLLDSDAVNGGVTPRPPATPPTSKAGIRPECGIGQKAVLLTNPDRWVCVPEFK